jgi:hypothetical protein
MIASAAVGCKRMLGRVACIHPNLTVSFMRAALPYLRTAFVNTDLTEPVQVVRRRATLPWTEILFGSTSFPRVTCTDSTCRLPAGR